MKSGYGITMRYVPVITTLGSAKNGTTAVTPLQRVEARFPEFGFSSGTAYRRVLEPTGKDAGGNTVYGFMKNKYSRFLSRVHFTPLWYPDGTLYAVMVDASDLWTPAGQIAFRTASGPLLIDGGTMYDDWAIGLYDP